MKGKLAAGATASIALAFGVGFLRGYTWGIEYALNNVNNLRHHAECIGEGGCHWVYSGGSAHEGEPIAYSEPTRYLKPFSEMPWWGGNIPFLRDVKYDMVRPLLRNNVSGSDQGGVDIVISDETLIFRSQGAKHKSLTIPTADVVSANVEHDVARRWQDTFEDISAGGKESAYKVAALYREGDSMFWCVEDNEKTIVLGLSNGRYARLVTEVDDPEEAVLLIKAQIPQRK